MRYIVGCTTFDEGSWPKIFSPHENVGRGDTLYKREYIFLLKEVK